jgi:hypothetical protein
MSVWANFEQDPPPPPPDPSNCGGNTDYVSGCSPIVLNFAHGAYHLTGANAPVSFDIAATGHPSWIGWTAGGEDEAFLCLDRDHDGIIDTGAELFGTATPLNNGQTARNGFEALAELDSNRDNRIDADDEVWPLLILWRDLNHNGISEPSELAPVATSALRAIGTDHHWTGRRDSWGNVFKYESQIWVVGKQGQVTPRPVYDIFFIRVR